MKLRSRVSKEKNVRILSKVLGVKGKIVVWILCEEERTELRVST